MITFFHALRATGQDKVVYRDAGTLSIAGSYGNHITPKSVWHNGATYITGYRENQDPAIIKWKDGEIQYTEFGTSEHDPYNHPHPTVVIIDNYVYVLHVDGHNNPIKIWKSDLPESIESFTLIHTTTYAEFNYCNPRMLSDGRMVIHSRRGSAAGFNSIFAMSGINDLTTWTVKELTVPDWDSNKVRHYPDGLYHYGANEWYYFGIFLRYENGEVYFGHAHFKTKDFITFYSLDESFSKNIDIEGGFTRAEIETYLMTVGSNTQPDTYTGPPNTLIINDTVYDNFYNMTNQRWEMIKITPDGTKTFYPCTIPNILTGKNLSHPILQYYNGQNIVLIITEENLSRKIYSTDLNYQTFKFEKTISETGEEEPINRPLIPWNFSELNGKYIIGGGMDVGIFPYMITDEKFLI